MTKHWEEARRNKFAIRGPTRGPSNLSGTTKMVPRDARGALNQAPIMPRGWQNESVRRLNLLCSIYTISRKFKKLRKEPTRFQTKFLHIQNSIKEIRIKRIYIHILQRPITHFQTTTDTPYFKTIREKALKLTQYYIIYLLETIPKYHFTDGCYGIATPPHTKTTILAAFEEFD